MACGALGNGAAGGDQYGWRTVISHAVSLFGNVYMRSLLVPLFYWGYIYTDIGATGRERMQIIAEAIDTNAVEITLPKFLHEEYLWEPDPKSEYRKKYFRLFYGLNEDVEINLGEGGM